VNTSGVNFDIRGQWLATFSSATGADTLTVNAARRPRRPSPHVSFGGNSTATLGASRYAEHRHVWNADGAVTETLGSHLDVMIASGGHVNLENGP